MSKLKQVLDQHYKLREFISLCQAIEDRLDPLSKFHNWTVNQLCERFEVPRSTFYRKNKNYQHHGLWGIVPRRRGPKGSRIEPEMQQRIRELRDLQLSSKSISTIISVENKKKLATSTTHHFLRRIGKSRLKRNKKKKKQLYKRFERGKPNELWQIDNVGPFYKPGKLFAFNVVDDHSRFCLSIKISDNQSTQSWVDLLDDLVTKYGKPEAILHDNGSQFVSPWTGRLTTKFHAFLQTHGIRSVRSRIRHPETCGKVERMQQSMQYEVRDLVYTDDMHQLQFTVDAWRSFYNEAERFFGRKPRNIDMLAACQFYEHSLINFSKR
ncbi:MAG: DDE-type integrase/transposase/recombinase [Candidatus Hodarchaeales archaeon]|jgi:transposase InsO family protein